MKKILLGSKNKGKIQEFQEAFEDSQIEILSLNDFPDCPDAPETGNSFEENASQKALFYQKFTGLPSLADDSGIEVDALDGAPGIYSARYAGEPVNDLANNRKLLENLEGIPSEKRTGRFVCVLALAKNGQIVQLSRGTAEGIVLEAPRGENGFGYDPLFFVPNLKKTMAELSITEKRQISHRGEALRKFVAWFKGQK